MSKQSLTPRQRAALAFPISDPNARDIHPRHHRMNGHFQTILTFDLLTGDKAPAEIRSWMHGEFFGMWHARVACSPPRPLAELSKSEVSYGERYVKRLLETVGQFEITMSRHDNGLEIHGYRCATMSELAQTARALEGRR